MRENVLWPATLAMLCFEQKTHCIILGSGAVHSNRLEKKTETDALEPPPSTYARYRAELERLLAPFFSPTLRFSGSCIRCRATVIRVVCCPNF